MHPLLEKHGRTAGIAAAAFIGLFLALSLLSSFWYGPRALLVSAREFVFSRSADDFSAWQATPKQLQADFGFRTDTPQDIKQLSHDIAPVLPKNSPLVRRQGSALTQVMRALRGTGQAACGRFDGLGYAVTQLTQGKVSGCCSDYTQAFLALAETKNIFARELRISGHTFAEAWMPEYQKWVWVDPMFGTVAKKGGVPLSFLELRAEILAGKDPVIRDVRKHRSFRLSQAPEKMRPLYTKENLALTAMLLGNNVYAEDAFEQHLRFLPKSLRQLLSYAFGIKPPTLTYREVRATDPSE